MWAAVIAVVLVCGYHYTKCHLPSRYRQNKAIGWNAYFDVALKGGEFLVSGIIITIILASLIYFGMWVLNIPLYLFPDGYQRFTFASDLFAKKPSV